MIDIIFPSDNNVSQATSFAQDFVSRARHLNGQLVLGELHTQDSACVTDFFRKSVVPMPGVINLDDFLAQVCKKSGDKAAETIGNDLAGRAAMFTRHWRAALASIDGDETVEESVQALAQSWHERPAGSLVYRRKTRNGEFAVVSHSARIDLDTGKVVELSADVAPMRTELYPSALRTRPVVAVEAADATKTVVDAALTLATFIGFGIGGPAGIAVAGLASTLEVIFNSLFSSNQVPLATQIDKIVKSEIQEDHIVTATASFNTYIQWFKTNYDASFADQLDIPVPADPTQGTEAFQGFLKSLDNALDPSNPLLQSIGLLQSGNYNEADVTFQMKALQAFQYGASLHMNFLKLRILLDGIPSNTLKSPFLPEFVSYAKSYIDHANSVTGEIDKAIAARVGKISALKSGSETFCGGMGPCSITTGLYFEDPDADQSWLSKFGHTYAGLPSDTIMFIADNPGSCCKAGTPKTAEANKARDNYVNEVTSNQRKKYVYTQSDKIKQVVATWQSSYEKYKKYRDVFFPPSE